MYMFCVMSRIPPISTRTVTLFPYTTLVRYLRSPGIFESARPASEVEQRQRGAGRAGVGIAAVLEQTRQRGAQGAERARQRDRGEERRARRADEIGRAHV